MNPVTANNLKEEVLLLCLQSSKILRDFVNHFKVKKIPRVKMQDF